MGHQLRSTSKEAFTRAGSLKTLVSITLLSACGTYGDNRLPPGDQLASVSADATETCSATPPAIDLSTDDIALAPAELADEATVDGTGTGTLLPDAGGPGCDKLCMAIADQASAACLADYNAGVQVCSDIWYQCMGWPLMRCLAKATCDADYTSCVAGYKATKSACNTLTAVRYNSCLANVCGEAQN